MQFPQSQCCNNSYIQPNSGCGNDYPIVPGANPALQTWNGQNFIVADGSAQNRISLPFLQVNSGAATYVVGADNNGVWSYYSPNLSPALAGGSAGQVPWQISTNVTGFTTTGTSGQLLQSGATNSPTWITPNNLLVTATGSTTARTLANRFGDISNVKDFGAVGDGITDDTAAFVAAINSNSKLILIPRGIYYVPNPSGIYSIDNISTLWLSAGAQYTTTSGGSGTDFSGIFFGEIMPRDFGPIAVANNNIPNTAGEAAGIKIITGQFPTATPAIGDRVAGTFITDNINKTTAGGGIWGLNVLAAQGPINSDGSPATDSMTRSAEFEVAKVLGGANPDPWSGAAPYRANGIEIVGMDGSVYQPTAALTTWANDSTGTKWWQIGAALSRITKWGVLFKKNPGGSSDTGLAFGGSVTTGAAIRDESDSTSVISVSGSHVNFADLSGATNVSTFVRGINTAASNIGFANFANYDNSIIIDSGNTTAQSSQLLFNDRGTATWTLNKIVDGRFQIYSDSQSIPLLLINPFDRSLALSSGAKIFSAAGSPEGNVTAPIGSIYTNTSGGASTTLYVKTSGTGNTGWTAK